MYEKTWDDGGLIQVVPHEDAVFLSQSLRGVSGGASRLTAAEAREVAIALGEAALEAENFVPEVPAEEAPVAAPAASSDEIATLQAQVKMLTEALRPLLEKAETPAAVRPEQEPPAEETSA